MEKEIKQDKKELKKVYKDLNPFNKEDYFFKDDLYLGDNVYLTKDGNVYLDE